MPVDTPFVHPGRTFFLTACLYDTRTREILSRTFGMKRLRASVQEQYFPYELNSETQPGAVAVFGLIHPEDLRGVQHREARLSVPLADWAYIARSGVYVAVNPGEMSNTFTYKPVEDSHLRKQ